MTIVVFILILSILVLVHEFGHFIVAKKNGIRVEEFGLGLPPKIWGKKIGETLYSLNLLPFGGFVKLTGEDDTGESSDNCQANDGNVDVVVEESSVEIFQVLDNKAVILEESVVVEETSDIDSESFASKTPWQRLSVLLAGVFMNAILAIVIFYVYLLANGFKTYQMPLFFDFKFPFGEQNKIETVVIDIQKDSAAEKAGVKLGDAVMSIDTVPVKNVLDVRNQLAGKQDREVKVEPLNLRELSNSSTRYVMLKPLMDQDGNAILGVYLSKSVSIGYQKPLEKTFAGFLHAYNVLAYSMDSFSKIIGISVATRDIAPVSQSVSGPVGIYNVIGAVLKYGGKDVFITILDYIGLMSLSLAMINVLPFPALDGGRAFFVIVEAIRGRKVDPKWEANVHKLGMIFLLGLIILITIKDLVI